jgi:hypothetical protein
MAKPNAVEQDGNVITGFIEDGSKFWPPSCLVNRCESMDFLNGTFAWLRGGFVSYIPRTN